MTADPADGQIRRTIRNLGDGPPGAAGLFDAALATVDAERRVDAHERAVLRNDALNVISFLVLGVCMGASLSGRLYVVTAAAALAIALQAHVWRARLAMDRRAPYTCICPDDWSTHADGGCTAPGCGCKASRTVLAAMLIDFDETPGARVD